MAQGWGKSKMKGKEEKLEERSALEGCTPPLCPWAGIAGSLSFAPAFPAWTSLPACAVAFG